MKMIENHVSDSELTDLIDSYTFIKRPEKTVLQILKALLELKQRRAQDRKRENDGK